MSQGNIPETELLMYMRGMEIHTEHYKNVYDKHMDLLGYDCTLSEKPVKYWRIHDNKRKQCLQCLAMKVKMFPYLVNKVKAVHFLILMDIPSQEHY